MAGVFLLLFLFKESFFGNDDMLVFSVIAKHEMLTLLPSLVSLREMKFRSNFLRRHHEERSDVVIPPP